LFYYPSKNQPTCLLLKAIPIKLKFKKSERKMKKYLLLVLIYFTAGVGALEAKTGIAASGGLLYPGFFKSDRYGYRFRIGPGFDITLRHHLFKFSPTFKIDSRYSIRNYFCDVNLHDGSARFQFAYLSIDLTTTFSTISHWQFYGGGGLSLTTISGERFYTRDSVTDTVIMPELLTGAEFLFGENFNIYLEMQLQYGSISIEEDRDRIPVHGVKISLGGTMFLTSE
jgi:hypothetical protein